MIKFLLVLLLLCFIFSALSTSPGCNSQAARPDGVLEVDTDSAEALYGGLDNNQVVSLENEYAFTEEANPQFFGGIFKKIIAKVHRAKESKEWDKVSHGEKGEQVDHNSNGCMNKYWYCKVSCGDDFATCESSRDFILFVPQQQHTELCVLPRLKKDGGAWYAGLTTHKQGECITNACSCETFRAFFQKKFPILYGEKMANYRKKCADWCAANQRPTKFTSLNAAKALFQGQVKAKLQELTKNLKKKFRF